MLHRPAEAEEKEEKHMGYMEEYKFWLEAPYFDPKTKEELKGTKRRSRTGFIRNWNSVPAACAA